MSEVSAENKKILAATAKAIVANGKGILAADESVPTVGKRFAGIGLENNEENRRKFREMLFLCPNVEKYFGGIIFFEESLYQKTGAGITFTEAVKKRGICVGIKVDKGMIELPGGKTGEKFTRGMDDLNQRMAKFRADGCDFAKWRCVIQIDVKNGTPTELAVMDVAFTLARYARICQDNCIVPIVEPEVLIDGSHDLESATKVTEHVLSVVYSQLHLHNVYLEGTLLKPNMVTPGQQCSKRATPEEIAMATVSVLSRTVPAAVPGITFLFGGQSEMEATKHLNAINKVDFSRPWALTFSFARALQNSCIKNWGGKAEGLAKAHETLTFRAALNSQAAKGLYNESLETDENARQSLFVKGHTY
uniref:Fructose-bisphosphate aldolase n=1 Tax=Salmo salar TaxID=8030 RepID=B5XE29_SALSA|nr:Fructose-bisphosphate aldolase, muscle type [Salmo salar]ACI69099.1 Fructose-bisphosphate aldolase, muscle type [Salmo salar]